MQGAYQLMCKKVVVILVQVSKVHVVFLCKALTSCTWVLLWKTNWCALYRVVYAWISSVAIFKKAARKVTDATIIVLLQLKDHFYVPTAFFVFKQEDEQEDNLKQLFGYLLSHLKYIM